MYNNLQDTRIFDFNALIISLNEVALEHNAIKREKEDISFNVFTLSSDLYYRENFHSDILKAFLDPTEKHNEGNKFLAIFIKMLGLNPNHYQCSLVLREKHDIDILIVNEESKKAIIVENKVNSAIDMPQQLPRYYDSICNDYTVEAIVYMPFQDGKTPDMTTWKEEEKVIIEPLLQIIPFVSTKQKNIIDNWINPSIFSSSNIDAISILRQYHKLLHHLKSSSMDITLYKKFYDLLREDNKFEIALSLKEMLARLPEYLVEEIYQVLRTEIAPFTIIEPFKSEAIELKGVEIGDVSFQIDVFAIWDCERPSYLIDFFVCSGEIECDIKQYFNDIDCLRDCEYKDINKKDCVQKQFDIFKEVEVFNFVKNIREGLLKKKTKENNSLYC